MKDKKPYKPTPKHTICPVCARNGNHYLLPHKRGGRKVCLRCGYVFADDAS